MTQTTPSKDETLDQFVGRRVKEILGNEWYLFGGHEKVIAAMQAEKEWKEHLSYGLADFLKKKE